MRSTFRAGLCVWAAATAAVIVVGFNHRVETQRLGDRSGVTDAPTGFDLASNGFAEEFCLRQNEKGFVSSTSPKIPARECNFEDAAAEFLGPESVEDGVGPVFNAAGCGECHGTPILGGSSQVNERRAGYIDSASHQFVEHPGGSLIHDRAIDASIQEVVIDKFASVFTFRASQSILGDGFVEAIDSSTLSDIASDQPSGMRGQLISVPVFEKPGATRTGRFGWKAQQASLLSFSADAYLNEMGITSPLQPTENSSNGRPVGAFDKVPTDDPTKPDDEGVDVELFALFMRSTLAPPRDEAIAARPDAIAGSRIFDDLGCSVCHTREIVTAAPETPINGGALKVARALGNKRIKPFGDFLLHDVGTGDGIVQNGGASTRNKVRTAPLWGLRARSRFMHDGLTQTVTDAIERHAGQASAARNDFGDLSSSDKNRLLAFLSSL